MTRLSGSIANAPGPGDLTRTGDPQNDTPGASDAPMPPGVTEVEDW